MEFSEREAALIEAVERKDLPKLVQLYSERANELEDTDLDAACFYMVNAYVYALELGAKELAEIREFLVEHGREEN